MRIAILKLKWDGIILAFENTFVRVIYTILETSIRHAFMINTKFCTFFCKFSISKEINGILFLF